jgi:hypothetical protein
VRAEWSDDCRESRGESPDWEAAWVPLDGSRCREECQDALLVSWDELLAWVEHWEVLERADPPGLV